MYEIEIEIENDCGKIKQTFSLTVKRVVYCSSVACIEIQLSFLIHKQT